MSMENNELPDVNSKQIKNKDVFSLKTHNGHKLTIMEDKFINIYLECGDEGKAVEDAGYKLRATIKNTASAFKAKGRKILAQPYIQDEIKYRLEQFNNQHIANAEEVLQYFTSVMRGEIADQFGLDAPLSERTAAAKELARRVIDAPQDKGESNELRVVIERKKR